MFRFVLPLTALVFTAPMAYAKDVSEATLAYNQWVVVENFQGIHNEDTAFNLRDKCFIRRGEKVQVIDKINSTFLVRSERRTRSFGTQCPNGTEFSLSKWQLTHPDPEFEKKLDQERERSDEAWRQVEHGLLHFPEPKAHDYYPPYRSPYAR